MSRLSANNKGNNEVKLRAVDRSPGKYITVEEKPRKSRLGDGLIKPVKPIIASDEIAYLKIMSVRSYSTSSSERENEGSKGGWTERA